MSRRLRLAPLGIRDKATAAESLTQSARIVDVLAHELAHAIVGVEAGHKAPFKRAAVAVGLTGKMTATVATPELDAWSATLIGNIGAFPTGGLNESGRKKQGTRLIKAYCPACDYTVRVTMKWINEAGAPICPVDHTQFTWEEELRQ